MDEGKEKRRDPRVPLVLRVEYPGVSQSVRDVTENLSAGGLFIRTDRVLAEGERLPLQVSFPGLLPPFEVEVQVVRRRPAGEGGPAGVAVRVPADRVDERQKLARLAGVNGAGARRRGAYHVLVVEDNPHVLEMYEYALRRLRSGKDPLEVAVEFAANGEEALQRLGASPRIDLVLTDLYMPVMDGFALVERLRADPLVAETPVMVISGGGPDARERAVELGVDVYLQKPVQFADVMGTVRTLLRVVS